MAKDDISELARLMERWAGAEMRGRAAEMEACADRAGRRRGA
jgi:hypothetical protein